MLQWLRDPALRRRVTAGLNKGEARNALARAVFGGRVLFVQKVAVSLLRRSIEDAVAGSV
jgi:hypothetical protein